MHNPDDVAREPAELSAMAVARRVIEDLRVKRGYRSRRALAQAADIQQPTLQRFLDGTSQSMDLKHIVALARALNVTVSELLGEVPLNGIPLEVRELEAIYMALPESGKRTVEAVARELSRTR